MCGLCDDNCRFELMKLGKMEELLVSLVMDWL